MYSENNNLPLFLAEEESPGVFWIVEDMLYAFPYGCIHSDVGISKSGKSYNHKRLWEAVCPSLYRHGFNYYPRGRVEIRSKGKPIIYMNPNISLAWIPEIKRVFHLLDEPKIHYDCSVHYRCYLDDNFQESW